MTITTTATVTNIGKTLEERINAIIESGHLTYEDEDQEVTRECARRYVDAEHRRFWRNSSRNVEQATKVRQDASDKLVRLVSRVVAEIQDDLRSGWNVNLLESSFALNGVRVTWANATIDQHETRAAMLESMAAGDLQTASIHRQAVQDILAGHVATLAGLAHGC
jgi:hypothetical protein